MRPRSVFHALCLLTTLAIVACGTEDDSSPGPTAGSSGKGNAGSSGKGNAGSGGNGNAGKAGGGESGSGENAGASDGGAAGEPGIPPLGCTHLSELVHSMIKDDTTAKSVPRPVNDLVLCDDPADPGAYSDLF